jgi:hypothetical protein
MVGNKTEALLDVVFEIEGELLNGGARGEVGGLSCSDSRGSFLLLSGGDNTQSSGANEASDGAAQQTTPRRDGCSERSG